MITRIGLTGNLRAGDSGKGEPGQGERERSAGRHAETAAFARVISAST